MFQISREKALEVRSVILSVFRQKSDVFSISTAVDLTTHIRASDNPYKKILISEELAKKISLFYPVIYNYLEMPGYPARTNLLESEGREMVATGIASIQNIDHELINRHDGFHPKNS